MDFRDKIIFGIAKAECERISDATIATLQSMTEGMQSGDDTSLANIWDEICVQVQDEESVMWEAYTDTIHRIILSNIKDLPKHFKESIWLQTNNGLDWECSEHSEVEKCPCDDDAIAHHIMNEYVLTKAGNDTNPRIEQFLHSDSEPITKDSDACLTSINNFGCRLCASDDAGSASRHKREHVSSLVDKSHFGLDILACPDCGQKFLQIFTEFVDFTDGDDISYSDLLPITEDEADKLIADGKNVSLVYIERIGSDRRHLKRDPSGPRWAEGGLRVLEGH